MATMKQRTLFNRENQTRGGSENWVKEWNAICREYKVSDLQLIALAPDHYETVGDRLRKAVATR